MIPIIGSFPVALAIYIIAGVAADYWPRRRNLAWLWGITALAALSLYAAQKPTAPLLFVPFAVWQIAVGLFLWVVFFVPAMRARA